MGGINTSIMEDKIKIYNARFFENSDCLYRQFFGLASELISFDENEIILKVWISRRWISSLHLTAEELIFHWEERLPMRQHTLRWKIIFFMLPSGIDTISTIGYIDNFGLKTFVFEQRDFNLENINADWPSVTLDGVWNRQSYTELKKKQEFVDHYVDLECWRRIFKNEAQKGDAPYLEQLSNLANLHTMPRFDWHYNECRLRQQAHYQSEVLDNPFFHGEVQCPPLNIKEARPEMREMLRGHAIKEWALFMFSFETRDGLRFFYDTGCRYHWFYEAIAGYGVLEQVKASATEKYMHDFTICVYGIRKQDAVEIGRKYGNLCLIVGDEKKRWLVRYEKPEMVFGLSLN